MHPPPPPLATACEQLPPGGARRPTCTRLLENQARQGRPRDAVCSCQPELWGGHRPLSHSRAPGASGCHERLKRKNPVEKLPHCPGHRHLPHCRHPPGPRGMGKCPSSPTGQRRHLMTYPGAMAGPEQLSHPQPAPHPGDKAGSRPRVLCRSEPWIPRTSTGLPSGIRAGPWVRGRRVGWEGS